MARKKQDVLVLFPEALTITRKFSDAQFGSLMRAVLAYRFNGNTYSGEDVAVDVAFQTITGQIERYLEYCQKQSSNAKGSENTPSAAKGSQTEPQESEGTPSTPPNPNPNPNPNPYPNPVSEDKAHKPPAPTRKQYGLFGWVKLTETEYSRLVEEFGTAETQRCIDYIDEAAQSTGNKNKWRDWNLVVRKCHREGWGLSRSSPPRGGTPIPDYGGNEQWSL